jgi:hypothetical protein
MSLTPSGLRGSDLEISVELKYQGVTATTSYTLLDGAHRQAAAL